MAQFEMVGKLAIAKDGEKRKAFDELKYKKGSVKKDGTKRTEDFIMRTLRLTMETAEDFFNVRIQGSLMGTEDTAKIYSLVKNDEGKYESIEFKYRDREDYIHDLAEFKKFVFVDGEERFEFVNEYEFSMFVHDKLKSGEYKDKIFKIKGDMTFTNYINPQTKEESTFVNYDITRIYVGANDNLEQIATANMNVMLTQNSVDDSRLDEERLLVINGYVTQYESKEQPNKGYYTTFEFPMNVDDAKMKRKAELITSKMELPEDKELGTMSFKVQLINRVQKVSFNEEMLTDEDREMIELGIMTMADFEQEYGDGTGGRITKYEVIRLPKGKMGVIPSELTIVDILKDVKKEKTVVQQDLDIDLDGTGEDLEDEFADVFGE